MASLSIFLDKDFPRRSIFILKAIFCLQYYVKYIYFIFMSAKSMSVYLL